MIIKNLTIVQHQNTLHYAIMEKVIINLKSINPNQKDYVYLQQTTLIMFIWL
jgi:hypothetical protein